MSVIAVYSSRDLRTIASHFVNFSFFSYFYLIHWFSIKRWELKLPAASQNCAKTSHFCAPTAQVGSKVFSLYNPFCSIFVNFHSRYTRDWKQAKESFMIVRFWGCDRNCVERVPPPQPCERLRFLRHPPECFRDKPARRQGGAYPEFEIPVYPIARLLRSRRAHSATRLLAMTSWIISAFLGHDRNCV